MAALDFLTASTNPDAELVVILPDSTAERIRNLSTDEIRYRCPLLYFAFEDPLQSPRQASIEATSLQVVTCFLRYLYTGNYLKPDEEPQECSLRLHVELYKMADDFQVPELQVNAYVNFIESTEWSCSFPSPPLGLCDAIQFIYKHIAYDKSHQQQGLIESLLSYCLSSFRYHRLDENPDFRQVVFDNPAFHKQLCETSMARDFQDDGKWLQLFQHMWEVASTNHLQEPTTSSAFLSAGRSPNLSRISITATWQTSSATPRKR
jgi:hypothetical protein